MLSAISTEVLIGIQVLVFLVLVIGMLLLLVRRQKKTIAQLQAILTEYKDDISGDSLVRHFQLEIDNTAAHCKQDSVALKPDLSAEDMAIALRYSALQTELALVQDTIGTRAPWREQIKRYEELAQRIHEMIQARVEQATRVLKDAHNDELEDRAKTIQQLETTRADLQQQVKQLKPLQDFVRAIVDSSFAPNEIEQKLHRSLLDICENFTGTEKLRELVFLLHEAFHEMGARNDNTMMHYESNPAPYDDAEARKVIEKFNEESAAMVEKIHLLSNENKQLMLENEQLRQSGSAAGEDSQPMVAGLKLLIEKQKEEIVSLQNNFKELEEKYLELYAEKAGG